MSDSDGKPRSFSGKDETIEGIRFVDYMNEAQLEHVMALVGRDLSEPYSSAYTVLQFADLSCLFSSANWCHILTQYISSVRIFSVFTYRYFLHRFPELCILAVNEEDEPIGCVVGKIDEEEVVLPPDVVVQQEDTTEEHAAAEEDTTPVGYIGMLAVSEKYRRRGIGKALVQRILRRMRDMGCTSATLETEVTNKTAGKLYHDLGFVRDEFLLRYYLNWSDAYRLRLWF